MSALGRYSCLVLYVYIYTQGWFSPGQVFVLDEYCARYGVRGCHRHLCYLSDLLDFAQQATMVDPTLIHYSFAFCASHTHGNRSGHRCLLVALVFTATCFSNVAVMPSLGVCLSVCLSVTLVIPDHIR